MMLNEKSHEIVDLLKREFVLKASKLTEFSVTRAQLRRMADEGLILDLGAGFYAHPMLDRFVASVLAVARHHPEGVISNRTALVIHELSDERIDRIDLDIPRNRSIRNRLVNQHRVSDTRRTGDVQYEYHGQVIHIYSKERALSEAYLIDPEGQIFFKALKRYLSMGVPQTSTIAQFDSSLKTEVLRALTQELADD